MEEDSITYTYNGDGNCIQAEHKKSYNGQIVASDSGIFKTDSNSEIRDGWKQHYPSPIRTLRIRTGTPPQTTT